VSAALSLGWVEASSADEHKASTPDARTEMSSDAAFMDEIALAQILGRARASFDICGIANTAFKQADLDVMATARYIVSARYRQLGRDSTSAIEAEQQAYGVYVAEHKLSPTLLDCAVYERQISTVAWDAALVSAAYIRENELRAAGPRHPN
jgi:hypothetical protein